MLGDWQPTASIQHLRRRSEIAQQLRQFFLELGFWEVETPLLSRDTVVDIHLDPIPVQLSPAADILDGPPVYYLQTSPEFGMKRLLAAGADSIFQICKAFRLGESGQRHNPEFTLVEWYRAGDDLTGGMQLLSDLAEAILDRGPAELVTYQELFQNVLRIDPLTATFDDLRTTAEVRDISIPSSFTQLDRDGVLEILFDEAIQPRLGVHQPTIVYHYPASQAALAKLVSADSRVAGRFELFVDGVELANGYDELLDPAVLHSRNESNNSERLRLNKAPLPGDSRLLDAMQHGLPSSCGCALGLDRLVMVVLGFDSIDQVLSFPIDRA